MFYIVLYCFILFYVLYCFSSSSLEEELLYINLHKEQDSDSPTDKEDVLMIDNELYEL